MRKPILAGHDPRAADRAPVEFGVAAARFTGAPLIVASVQAGAPGLAASGQVDPDLFEDCSEQLGLIDADLHAAGIRVECRVLEGLTAARALHEAAEELGAALLVVGSSRRSGIGHVLLGSTAQRIMHGAPCPVAVAPHEWTGDGEPRTIGVAFVDTPEGQEALQGAYALARRAGAHLRVVQVVKLTPRMYREVEPSYVAGQLGKDLEDIEGEHRLAVERRLRATIAALGDDVTIEAEAVIGDPADVLVDVSRHLDLLVCGSRGYGPLRAVMLGSVSRRVTAEAHCPVVVLPRGIRTSLEALVAELPGAAAPA